LRELTQWSMRCPISIVSCHKNEARATELDEGPRIGEKVCRITAQGGAGVTVFWSNQRNIPATSRPLHLSRSGTGSKPCESKKFAGCGIKRRCVICTLVKGGDLFGAPYQRHTVRTRPRNRNNFVLPITYPAIRLSDHTSYKTWLHLRT
jgi:hypothetical protein